MYTDAGAVGLELFLFPQVFRFLDVGDLARCALTCRTWQEVAVTASLHHNLRFSPFRQAYVPQAVNVFCTCLIMMR